MPILNVFRCHLLLVQLRILAVHSCLQLCIAILKVQSLSTIIFPVSSACICMNTFKHNKHQFIVLRLSANGTLRMERSQNSPLLLDICSFADVNTVYYSIRFDSVSLGRQVSPDFLVSVEPAQTEKYHYITGNSLQTLSLLFWLNFPDFHCKFIAPWYLHSLAISLAFKNDLSSTLSLNCREI